MQFNGAEQGAQIYQVMTKRIEDDEIHINSSNKDDIEEVIAHIVNQEAFGDESKLNAVMFKGLPGTGKTYTAHYIRTKVSHVLNKDIPVLLVGSLKEPEDVMKLYADARALAKDRGRCIIFDDEVDKYGKRGEIQDSAREAVLNQILMEMQSSNSNEGVITICCSNRPDKIDPAYRRGKRCGKEIVFDPLDKTGREHISKIEAYKRNHQFIVDNEHIGYVVSQTFGAVGADISQLFTDVFSYANLQLKRKLEEIAKQILFEDKPDKAKITKQMKDLPIENLEVKLDEIVASMIGNKKGFIAENKDVKEDDDFYQTKMQERYARALFKQINPNKDDDKPNLDEKEKKKVKRWLHIKQEDIDHVLEHFVPSALKEMPFEETTLTFDKLGGMDSEIKYLKRVVENTIAKDKEGTTIYIYGKPGLGVTSLARAIAGQYGYNLIVMYGADQESKWVAEAKDRLLDINDKAKASKPSIVVFDNIKYLTLNEGSADQSYKQAATSAIKSIIKPTKGVIYIATGETLDELDPSTRSLFKRCIEIKAPEKTEDYMKIWMNCLNPDYISEGTIKLEELAGASKGLTGGEINNICRCFSELGVNYTQKKLEQLLGLYKKNKDENMGARSAKAINDMDLATMILS